MGENNIGGRICVGRINRENNRNRFCVGKCDNRDIKYDSKVRIDKNKSIRDEYESKVNKDDRYNRCNRGGKGENWICEYESWASIRTPPELITQLDSLVKVAVPPPFNDKYPAQNHVDVYVSVCVIDNINNSFTTARTNVLNST